MNTQDNFLSYGLGDSVLVAGTQRVRIVTMTGFHPDQSMHPGRVIYYLDNDHIVNAPTYQHQELRPLNRAQLDDLIVLLQHDDREEYRWPVDGAPVSFALGDVVALAEQRSNDRKHFVSHLHVEHGGLHVYLDGLDEGVGYQLHELRLIHRATKETLRRAGELAFSVKTAEQMNAIATAEQPASFAVGDLVTLFNRSGCLVTAAEYDLDHDEMAYTVDGVWWHHKELKLDKRATAETLVRVRQVLAHAEGMEEQPELELDAEDNDDTDIDNDQGRSPVLAEDDVGPSDDEDNDDGRRPSTYLNDGNDD